MPNHPRRRSTSARTASALAAVCTAGLSGCTDTHSTPERAGAWFSVDPHVHSAIGSNDADAQSSLEAIAEVAMARGLAMAIVSDHSNSAGSMDCPTGDAEDCINQGPEFPASAAAKLESNADFTLRVGVELSPVESLETTSEPTGHIGCLPTERSSFETVDEPAIDRPAGAVDGGDGIDWCHRHEGFAVVNHPFSIAAWLNYDWSSDDYDAIEVFNGGGRFDAGDWDAVMAWACDAINGKPTVAVGGSDTHRALTASPPPGLLDQAIGYPTTWVRAEHSGGILGNLASGHTVVSDPETSLDAWAWTATHAVGPGETLPTEGRPAHLEVRAEVGSEGLVLEVINLIDGSCESDPRLDHGGAPEVMFPPLFAVAMVPGEPVSERLEIDSTYDSRIAVWIRPKDTELNGQSGPAIAAPIFIQH